MQAGGKREEAAALRAAAEALRSSAADEAAALLREAEREATAALDRVRAESREAVEAARAQAAALEERAASSVSAAQGEATAATRAAEDARAALARLEGARGTAEATKTKHARTPTKGPRGHRHRSGVEGLWGRGLRAALCNRLARYCPLQPEKGTGLAEESWFRPFC